MKPRKHKSCLFIIMFYLLVRTADNIPTSVIKSMRYHTHTHTCMCVILITYHPQETFQTVNNSQRFVPFKRGVREHYVFMHCSLLCERRENNIIIVDNSPCVIYAVIKKVIKNNICINKCPGAAAPTGRDFCYAPNTSLTARYTA